jgi:hypothetical protein
MSTRALVASVTTRTADIRDSSYLLRQAALIESFMLVNVALKVSAVSRVFCP